MANISKHLPSQPYNTQDRPQHRELHALFERCLSSSQKGLKNSHLNRDSNPIIIIIIIMVIIYTGMSNLAKLV